MCPSLKLDSRIAETPKSVQKSSGRQEFRWPGSGPAPIRTGSQKKAGPSESPAGDVIIRVQQLRGREYPNGWYFRHEPMTAFNLLETLCLLTILYNCAILDIFKN
jgi:hypothetical protein